MAANMGTKKNTKFRTKQRNKMIQNRKIRRPNVEHPSL